MKQTYLYLWYHLFQAQWDRRELVAPIMISLIEDVANTKATETRVPFGEREVSTSKM
jgi:hypothetical protein